MREKILIVEDEYIVANDLRHMLIKAGYEVCGIAKSVSEAILKIELNKPSWVLLDIILQGEETGIDLAARLLRQKIPFIYISANTNLSILEKAKATEPYGFLVKPFRQNDLLVMLDIAMYRHEQAVKHREDQELSMQHQMQSILDPVIDQDQRLSQLAKALQVIIPFDFLILQHTKTGKFLNIQTSVRRDGFYEYEIQSPDQLLSAMGKSQRDYKAAKIEELPVANASYYNEMDFRRRKLDSLWEKMLSIHFQLESCLLLPLVMENGEIWQLNLYSHLNYGYADLHLAKFNQYEILLKEAIFSVFNKVVAQLPGKPAPKVVNKSANEAPTAVQPLFDGIIGSSPNLLDVLEKLVIVAPSESSVLIVGESGTGKERIAHTIHDLSRRKSKPMITVNCAALPLNLIEAELFGHEKGAFTGATERRIGRFEEADGGTLFLDEIGELPLESQGKLLRVLQEKEISRLGGGKSQKIDVRFIAATNRNLEKEVAEGRFRLDLYYRINVFPLELPPLRERKEDIPLLASHFIQHFTKQSGKVIRSIDKKVMSNMQRYHWPGNIRQLEHLIERSVLLTQGDEITKIDVPLHSVSADFGSGAVSGQVKSLEALERDHILEVLKQCNGKVYGAGGAAEILKLPATTLYSKMKKLNIKSTHS